MVMTLPASHWGDGPLPLLLLHGFTGSSTSFDHLKPALASHVSATALDLPGHSGLDVPSAWSEVLDSVQAVLATCPSWCVLGYSQGARIALALAARGVPQLQSLVLVSGSPGLRRDEERAARRADDARLAERLVRDGLEAFLDTWDEQPLFSSLSSLPPDLMAHRKASRERHTAAGLAGALRVMGTGSQPSLWERLPGINVPALLVTGALDTRFTSLNADMAARLPRARHVVVPGAGHIPHLEQPDLFVRELIPFLEGNVH